MKLKKPKPIADDVLSRPIQWYHSHAVPIWTDGIFKDLKFINYNISLIKVKAQKGKV
jgi:hypothetical protein